MTRGLLFAAALLALARPAGAQVDTTERAAGPAPPDSIIQDTTTRDTTARDTTPALLPVFAAPRPPGPLPRGTRYSFTADSFAFSNVQTLSDLLLHIPGVYVARGGIYGQQEIVLYGGRGPAGLEVYWDGVPYLPLGRDSVYLDPARISLAPLERVDVIVLPASLRVYLVTARHQSTETATQVRMTTGEVSTAGYRGSYAKRWHSGIGLSLLADYNNNDGIAGSSSTAFNDVDLWFKVEYLPSPRLGVSYQILSSSWSRSPGPLTDRFNYKRRDGILRVFLASRKDGLGPRLAATYAAATAARDTAVGGRSLSQGILEVSNAWRRAFVGVALRVQGDERPFQVEGSTAWRPLRFVTVAADLRHASYSGSRSSNRAHLSGGVDLPFGLSAHGEVAWAQELQGPAVATASIQRTTDLAGALRWERSWVTLEVGGGRRDPFSPLGFVSGLKSVNELGRVPRTTFLSAHVNLRPLPGVHLATWYFDPVRGGGDFEPPTHARYSATFYSKFWRVYRSGIFALRGEVAAESWSAGLGGMTTGGAPQLILPGATFLETNLEIQVAGVMIFYIQRNANAMRGSYVPGLDYPRRFQYYGVRWLFTN